MIEALLDSTLDWVRANPGWVGIVIFLTALSESLAVVGLIVPGAMMMFGFGALIALDHVAFWPACAWAVAGAIAGDGLSFWLGRTLHERLRQLWPFSRHPEMLIRGEEFFQRHGGKSILFGRFFGPVRAVIPAVAGMLDMPFGRFFIVNVASALLWAPAYLLPGMVFAASLELAAQVAWRLVVLILLVVVLLWLTIWLVRTLFRLLQPRITDWLRRFYAWSQRHRFIGPISASLLDPSKGELRGLITLAALLLGSGAFLFLLLVASGREIPTAVDLSLYHFLRDLRTPWADQVMVFITELGDPQVYLPLSAAVFTWLYWNRAQAAALHWLAALGFGMVATTLFQLTLKVPSPSPTFQGISSYSFPSGHAMLSTVLYGFLAVLIARETAAAKRWIPYLGAALFVIPLAFSQLYLGANWLSDILAGLSLGVAWVALLGLGYNSHPAPPVGRSSLLMVCCAALVLADLLHLGLHHEENTRRYQVQADTEPVERAAWWQTQWRSLPAYRIDFSGDLKQALSLQWAATREELERRLAAAGWQPAPTLNLENALHGLNPAVRLEDLPVLPRVHDGRHADLVLIHPGPEPDTRWTLRFWDAGVRLEKSGTPIWLASFGLQKLQHRVGFLAFPVYVRESETPMGLLKPALKGLQVRTAKVANDQRQVMLVADRAE